MAKKSSREIVSISVPPSLRRRMANVRGVNWSAIARRAFEAELARIANRSEIAGMNDVVNRLRRSKVKSKPEPYQLGFQGGFDWAKEKAEAHELQRLEQLFQAHRNDADFDWKSFFGECSGGRGRKLKHRASAWGHFDDDEFVGGFVDGAMEVWRSVKGQL